MSKPTVRRRTVVPKDPQLKVGDTIWRFDINCREYRKDPKTGRAYGGPIYRSHWRPQVITSETLRSWVCAEYSHAEKAPKSGPHPGWAFTEKEVDDACWVNDYRAGIANALYRYQDADILRQIAKLIGWEPEKR